jgi:carbonic anhydrase
MLLIDHHVQHALYNFNRDMKCLKHGSKGPSPAGQRSKGGSDRERPGMVSRFSRAAANLKATIAAQAAVLAILLGGPGSAFANVPPSKVNPDQALQRLIEGNTRFASGHLNHTTPERVAQVRSRVAQGQRPFAIIVGCSDSRVGPELIFDQGLGDLFVVRTAGEVVDDVALGSIEYGVEHLGSALIVVLGHERCGAVSAAVAHAQEPGRIAAVLKAIGPAVEQTNGQPGDPVENAVRAQARDVAPQLQGVTPILAERVQAGQLKIVAARYDLGSGKVEWLTP